MHELFFEIGNYAIWIFVVTSIAAMGLNLTIPEVLAPWKKKWLLSISLVANFVIVPLFALFILFLFPLDIDLATGLIIVAAAAGAPSLPKAMDIIGGNVAYAVGLTMILIIVTIFYMPFMLPYLIEGVHVDQSSTALYLIVFMLIPLIVTMAIRAKVPQAARILYPVVDRISDLSIIAVLLIYTVALFTSDFSVKAGTLLGLKGAAVAILFILGSFAIGYVMGGPDPREPPGPCLRHRLSQCLGSARRGLCQLYRPADPLHGTGHRSIRHHLHDDHGRLAVPEEQEGRDPQVIWRPVNRRRSSLF